MTGPSDMDALYTDMGDVLVKIRADRFFSRLLAMTGTVDRAWFVDRVLTRQIYRDFSAGVTGPSVFAAQLADVLGISWSFEEFVDLWVDMFDEIPGTEQALDLALSALPVFILSNTDPVHWEYLSGRFPWLTRASGTFMSFDVGMLKPDPQYYLGALRRFGHDPSRVLFIDDRIENVEAARGVGLAAVHMTGETVFKETVERLWGR